MKKIAIFLTNIERYGQHKKLTGLWLGELIHFYAPIKAMGYEVDFISEEGGYIPIDPFSMKFMTNLDWTYYSDKSFRKKALAETKRAKEVSFEDYQACYYTGGHGVLWDFPKVEGLKLLAEMIYQKGGIISAVCHGVVGLLPLEVDGEPIIKNKSVTGFSNLEERLNGTMKKVPFFTEDALKEKGAYYFKARIPFRPFALCDGRLITGQNPQSPKKVAELLLKRLSI